MMCLPLGFFWYPETGLRDDLVGFLMPEGPAVALSMAVLSCCLVMVGGWAVLLASPALTGTLSILLDLLEEVLASPLAAPPAASVAAAAAVAAAALEVLVAGFGGFGFEGRTFEAKLSTPSS